MDREADNRAKGAGPRGIDEALDTMLADTHGKDHIRIGDILDTFGRQAFGPLILVPAVLLTLPTGALPGVPLVLGAFIAVICFEIVLGTHKPTIPRLFSRLKMKRQSVVKARQGADGIIGFVDRLIRPRLTFLVGHPFLEIIAVICIALCMLLLPLEFVPFATAIPGTVLILMGLAITARDGLLAMLGLISAGGAGVGAWAMLS
ncbi:MAG: hypothetical protein GC145_18260 [Caulobacter sp.]|nr:hypothetical protein [Caulobacter sp.]